MMTPRSLAAAFCLALAMAAPCQVWLPPWARGSEAAGAPSGRVAPIDRGIRVVGHGRVDVDMGRLMLLVRVTGEGESEADAGRACERLTLEARTRLRKVMGDGAQVRRGVANTEPSEDSVFDQFQLVQLAEVGAASTSAERAFAITAEPRAGESLLVFTGRALDAVADMKGVVVDPARYLPSNAAAAERRALAAAVSDARSRARLLAGFAARELGRPLAIDARAVAGLLPDTGFEHPGAQRLSLSVPVRFALLD